VLLSAGAIASCSVPTSESPAALYARYCALCHGQQGRADTGVAAPRLADPDFLAAASDDFLYTNVARGRPGTTMAAYSAEYGGPLPPATVRDIVAHVRTFGDPRAPTPEPFVWGGTVDPARGAALYAAACARCHEHDGTSETAPDLANPTFLDAASDTYLRAAVATGRGELMPPLEVSSGEMSALIAHIRALRASP
jgi:mono/diheme cytochrome c family protein